ncbi:MAG: 5-oxoprolinase subunit PxpB [Verrucomicrobia bacterium]|jgi:KipI family sensor histidine kinase inhibitor|nr:5-oxoprolinase subunit PxpB [Verrucomicrobiota bacterium]
MGDRSLLVELGERISPEINRRVEVLMDRLARAELHGVREISPSYRSLMILVDPLKTTLGQLQPAVAELAAADHDGTLCRSAEHLIPVVYGGEHGPDLEWVAAHHGVSGHEIVARHTASTYRVYMIGFTPGFPYLGELPADLDTPRRGTPRTRVPKGSVGLAQRQTGIYPADSPGGWQIIGWTPIELFDPRRQPPSLLNMGDQVRFESIRAEEVDRWRR